MTMSEFSVDLIGKWSLMRNPETLNCVHFHDVPYFYQPMDSSVSMSDGKRGNVRRRKHILRVFRFNEGDHEQEIIEEFQEEGREIAYVSRICQVELRRVGSKD